MSSVLAAAVPLGSAVRDSASSEGFSLLGAAGEGCEVSPTSARERGWDECLGGGHSHQHSPWAITPLDHALGFCFRVQAVSTSCCFLAQRAHLGEQLDGCNGFRVVWHCFPSSNARGL